MPLIPVMPLNGDGKVENGQIDCSYPISQDQLLNAKIFSSREDYITTLPKNIRYLEAGVAWGYYSLIIADRLSPTSITLVDWYNQDLKCWSWRKFGECKCTPKHEMKYNSVNHMTYIQNEFSKYKNVQLIKGNSEEILLNLNQEFDYIYIDITNDRKPLRQTLHSAANLVPVGGIIGLNDYLIYDGIIEDKPYATYQVVNEFLHNNKNWKVDAIALHVLGFYDIYIKKSYSIIDVLGKE
jgi:predicted O-methyltransferase YrrM